MILKGQVVKIKPECQDPGDENYTWTAVEDERPATPGFVNAKIYLRPTPKIPGSESIRSMMEFNTIMLEPTTDHTAEYDAAAEWCAARGIAGKDGDQLPTLLDGYTFAEINADPEAFEQRVKDFAYALAMNACATDAEDAESSAEELNDKAARRLNARD